MKKLENEKKFEEVFNSFEEKGDSLFAIASCGKSEPIVSACGDPDRISDIVCSILYNGLSEKAGREQIATMIPILDGIRKLIAMKDMQTCKLMEILSKFTAESLSEEDEESDNEFYPTKEECINCEEYVDCLKKHMKEVGVEIEVKKMPKPKKNGK